MGESVKERDPVRRMRVVVDMRGRTFEAGAAVAGRPGIRVKEIRVIGNFVTVEFEREQVAPALPQPVVMHMGDVQAFVADSGEVR